MQIETGTKNHGKGYIRVTKGAYKGDLDEIEFELVLKTLARLPKAEFHRRKSSGKEHHQDRHSTCIRDLQRPQEQEREPIQVFSISLSSSFR